MWMRGVLCVDERCAVCGLEVCCVWMRCVLCVDERCAVCG